MSLAPYRTTNREKAQRYDRIKTVQEILELKDSGSSVALCRVFCLFLSGRHDECRTRSRLCVCDPTETRLRMALATAAHHSSQRVSSAFTQIGYVAPAPVTECVAPAPSSSYAAPAPVIEYIASPPVNLNMASPPCAATATLSPHQPNTLRATSLRSSELKPFDVMNVILLLFRHGLARFLRVDLMTHQRVVTEPDHAKPVWGFFPMKRGGAPTVHISPFCVTHGNVSSVTLVSS